MAKTADEFLNDLAQRDLVPAGTIASLRRQIAKANPPVTAEFLAKTLTDKGQLTSGQAQKILAEGAAAKAAAKPADDLGLLPLDENALLTAGDASLLPLDDGGLVSLEPARAPVAKPTAATAKASAKTPAKQPAKPASARAAAAPLPAAPAAAPAVASLMPLDDLVPLEPADEAQTLAPGPRADPLADANLTGPLAAAPAKSAASQRAAKKKGSLGVVLGAAALLLLLAGGAAAAYFFIPQGTGDPELDLAEADYQAKEYDAAIAKYDAVLAAYPGNPRSSLARVHRAAAKVLAARAASPRDWQPVLAAAKESLPPIGGEPDLAQAHAELAPLLAAMAAALADEAAASSDGAKLAQAREALALADDGRFVPGALRPWQRLEAARESLAVAARAGQMATARTAAVAAIGKAIDAQDPAPALAQQAKLLDAYPEAAGSPELRELAAPIARAAAAKVAAAAYSAKAETTESRPDFMGSVLFAQQAAAGGAGGPPIVVAAAGNAWGLDSGSGKLLWRRIVGENLDGAGAPIRIAGGDVLLPDALRDELLRVDAASGSLRWRHALANSPAGAPLVIGEQIIVTTRAGQVIALDAQSGHGKAAAQLPQTVRVGPVADPAGKLLYQVADDSLLYVLSAADLECVAAIAIGHQPASVLVAPGLTASHLVVAENRGTAATTLHVVSLDSAGLPAGGPEAIEISGQASGPLLAWQSRLAVLTDQGRVLAYESAAKKDEIKEVAATDAGSLVAMRFGAAPDGNLLVAGDGLRQFAAPVRGSMPIAWTALGDVVCLGPPQIAGSAAIVAHRPPGQPGIRAAAVLLASGKALWETTLAEAALQESKP